MHYRSKGIFRAALALLCALLTAVAWAQNYPSKPIRLIVAFPPAPILKRLQTELTGIAQSPEMKEQFERNGAAALTTTPADLTKLLKTETDKYAKVIKAAGIKLQ